MWRSYYTPLYYVMWYCRMLSIRYGMIRARNNLCCRMSHIFIILNNIAHHVVFYIYMLPCVIVGYDLIWYSMVWYDTMWYDMESDDMMCYGKMWYNMTWCSFDMIIVLYDLAWYHMIYDYVILDDLIWYETVGHCII